MRIFPRIHWYKIINERQVLIETYRGEDTPKFAMGYALAVWAYGAYQKGADGRIIWLNTDRRQQNLFPLLAHETIHWIADLLHLSKLVTFIIDHKYRYVTHSHPAYPFRKYPPEKP